jgi:hypothetical protein
LVADLLKHTIRRLIHSKAGLALPITFLILLVSTLSIISFTYAYSIERVNSQSQSLKVSTAKQNLLALNDAVFSTLWQPGSSSIFDLADSGGTLNIQPNNNFLTLSINYNLDTQETIFNASVGQVIYELPSSSSSQAGIYLRGDYRTITNQTGTTTSQMLIQNGADHPEIQLRYRPSLTYATAGLENSKAVNNIRIYLVNLNSSSSISSLGEIPLKISCKTTELISKSFELTSASEQLVVTSVLNGSSGFVTTPISSTPQGAIINLEIVISNISIQRWIN